MHIVDEYCSEESFNPVPEFTSQPKSSRQFCNMTTHKDESWFSVDSMLSVHIAIYKGPNGAQSVLRRGCRNDCLPTCDLEAMSALCKVRTDDFDVLKSQLEALITPDNHHQVS